MITAEEPTERYLTRNEYKAKPINFQDLFNWNNEGNTKYRLRDINIRPFNPKVITYDIHTYILHSSLKCLVTYEDDSFIIRNDLLDITVWGDDQDLAEEAFYFMFNAVYINYAKEKEEYLSEKAIILKHQIDNLITTIY